MGDTQMKRFDFATTSPPTAMRATGTPAHTGFAAASLLPQTPSLL